MELIEFTTVVENEKISENEFMENLSMSLEKFPLYKANYVKKFERKSDEMPAILITESVYNGLKKDNPNRSCIKENYWTEKPIKVKGFNGRIFGGGVIWSL